MKGQRVSLVIVLVLLNYLIISTVWSAVSSNSSVAPTATRTPKPTFTYEAEARTYVTSTPTKQHTPGLAMALTPVQGSSPTLAPTNTPMPPTATTKPPTSVNTATASPAPATATPIPTATPVIHTVVEGEMLLAIAIDYDVTVDEIMQANDLSDDDFIYVGQELIIPVATPAPETTDEPAPVVPDTPAPIATSFVHIVKAGENLAWIADGYGITAEAIAEANGLNLSGIIFVGQRLIIPATPATATPGATSTGRTHTVQAGENLTWIAGKYGVSVEKLMRANGIANADAIYAGQVLIIP